MIVKLETTIENLDSVHASITARAKSVAVPIDTLNRLLIDHSRMARTLEGMGVKLVTQEHKEPNATRKISRG